MTSNNARSNTTTAVIAITIMFTFVAAGIVTIVVAIPDGARASQSIATLLGFAVPTIGLIGMLIKQDNVTAKVESTESKVDDMMNGAMDAKLDAAVDRGFARWAGMNAEERSPHS